MPVIEYSTDQASTRRTLKKRRKIIAVLLVLLLLLGLTFTSVSRFFWNPSTDTSTDPRSDASVRVIETEDDASRSAQLRRIVSLEGSLEALSNVVSDIQENVTSLQNNTNNSVLSPDSDVPPETISHDLYNAYENLQYYNHINTPASSSLLTRGQITSEFLLKTTTLIEISDVNGDGLVSGKILKWDGTEWVVSDDKDTNTTYSASNGLTLTDTTFKLGGSLSADTAIDLESHSFTFQDGNVGIGITTPDFALQVNGVIAPETTDQDLGTTALRWDVFANTLNADSTVTLTGLSTGTDNTVLILDASNQVTTDEIDPRVWGTSLIDGSGTAGYVSYWSDTDTLSAEQYLSTSRGGLGNDVTAAGGGEIIYSTGTTTYESLPAGTLGYVLVSSGTGAPSWIDSGALGSAYWAKIAGVLSPGLGEPITATSSATTVATFTSNGSNLALQTGGPTAYATFDSSGNLLLTNGSGSTIDATAGLTIGGSTQTGLILGRSGVSTRIANLTTDGVVYTSGTNGTLNTEAQLAIARGGTNTNATPTAGTVTYGNGTAYAFTSVGITGQPLLSAGSGTPAWGTLGLTYGGTNADLSAIATGSIIYKGASALAGSGALTGVLKGNGAAAPTAMTGTQNYVTRWTDANTLGIGVIYDNGTNVGIGTTSPDFALQVNGVIAPETTDQDLGTTALRWNVFANTLNADSTVTLTGLGTGTDNTVLILDASNQVTTDEIDPRVWGTTLIDGTGTTGYVAYWSDTDTLAAEQYLSVARGGLGNDVTAAGAGEILYSIGVTSYDSLAAGSLGYVLSSGGAGSPAWVDPATLGTNYWQVVNGAFSPVTPYTNNADVLVGSNASASAKFAVLNVYPGTVGSPTASVSSGLSGTSMFMTADGTLATTNRKALTIGNSSAYDTTGNVLINPNNTGNVGIGTSIPLVKLDVQGSVSAIGVNTSFAVGDSLVAGNYGYLNWNSAADLLILSTQTGGSTMVLTEAGNVGIGTTGPSSFKLQVAGNVGPNTNDTYDLGSNAARWANVYATNFYQAGNAVCDVSGNCAAVGNIWQYDTGAISPATPYTNNSDLLIGSNASASAKFAVLNVYPGTAGSPTASVSSGLSGTSMFMTADGSLSTQNRMSLSIGNKSGNDTTGNVLINSNGTGNVGIGTTGPTYKLDVAGNIRTTEHYILGVDKRIYTSGGVNEDWFISLDGTSFNTIVRGFASGTRGFQVQDQSGNIGLHAIYGGNVGIGTTTIEDKLHVRDGNIRIQRTGGLSGGLILDDAGSDTDYWLGRIDTDADGGTDNDLFQIGDGTTIGTNPFITINTTGNVGIGSITPGAKLDVTGTGRFSSTVTLSSLGAGATDTVVTHASGVLQTRTIDTRVWGATLVDGSGVANYTARWTDANTLSTGTLYDTGTSVGIGTTSPDTVLHVRQATTLGSTLGNNQRVLSLGMVSGGNQVYERTWAYRDAAGADWLTTRIHNGISVDASFGTPGTDTKTWWERDPNNTIQSWGNAATTYMTLSGANLTVTGDVQANDQLISTVATGTAPLSVASTTVVANLNADMVDGHHADTAYNSFGNSTVPVRHASGYLYSNYFNMTADDTAVAATMIPIETGNDGFLRWQTPANFRSSIGVVAGGAGDIWVEKAGDTMSGILQLDSDLTFDGVVDFYYSGTTDRLAYRSGHTTATSLRFDDSDNTVHGMVYGDGNGVNFGLLDGDGNWMLQSIKDTEINFLVNNSEKMTVQTSGNVGIGTTTPSAPLHVERSNTTYNATTTMLRLSKRGDVNASNTDGAGARMEFASEDVDGNSITVAAIDGILTDPNYNGGGRRGELTFSTIPGDIGAMTERMRIDSAGNVGIGTSTPTLQLQVEHADVTAYSSTALAGDGILIRNLDNSVTNNMFSTLRMQTSSNNGTNNAQGAINLIQPTNASHDSNFSFQLRNSAGTYIEVMRMLANGNVGIGDTSPSYNLDVASTVRAQSKLTAKSSGTIGEVSLVGGSATLTGYIEWRNPVADGGAGTRRGYMGWNATDVELTLENSSDFIISGGEVGIGIASPTSELHIAGTTPELRIGDDGAEDASLSFMGNAQDYHIGLDDTSDLLTIGTGTALGTTPAIVVNSSGNVGIGTTTPSTAGKLQVDSGSTTAIFANAASATGYAVRGANSGTGWGIYAENSSTGYALYCSAGAANKCGGNQAWFNASDVRLKKDIVTIDNALNKVLNLRGVTYIMKNDPTNTRIMGFIAQESLPYAPEVVSYDEQNGYYGMQTSQLTALLVEAMQEQQAQINDLANNTQDNLTFTTEGELTISGQSQQYTITPVNDSPLANIIGASQAIVGKFTAGLINTRELIVTQTATIADLSVTNLTVSGQSINDYIRSIVQIELQNQPTPLPPDAIAQNFNSGMVINNYNTTVTIVQDQNATSSTTFSATGSGEIANYFNVTEVTEVRPDARFDILATLISWSDAAVDGVRTLFINAPTTFKYLAWFQGPVKVNADTSGILMIPANTLKARVSFSKPFPEVPTIYVNFSESAAVSYTITDTNRSGFTINFAVAPDGDLNLQWLALLRGDTLNGPSLEVMETGSAPAILPPSTPTPTPITTPSLLDPTPTPASDSGSSVPPETSLSDLVNTDTATDSATPSETATPSESASPSAQTP